MLYRVLLFYCFIVALFCNAMEKDFFTLFCNAIEEDEDVIHYTIEDKVYGATFFDNETILIIDGYNCSTLCTQTRKIKNIVGFDEKIQNFSLSKKGTLALVTSKLLDVYDVHTQKRLYFRDIDKSCYKISFCSDNESVIIFDTSKNTIFVSTKNSYKQLSFPIFQQKNHLATATNPINNDLFIANVEVQRKKLTDEKIIENKHTVLTIKENNEYNVKKNIKNKNVIISCEYNPNGTVVIMSDHKKYHFYKTDDYKEYLNKPKYHKDGEVFSHYYASMAFHPTEPFMALFDIRNLRVEFWNYIKKTKEPFYAMGFTTKKCSVNHNFLKCMSFSPNGDRLVVVYKGNNTIHILPIKKIIASFKAMYILPEAIFAYRVLKQFSIQNFDFLPNDIINLIIEKVFLSSNNQFIACKLRQ